LVRLRDKDSPDAFERFLIKRTESAVDTAFLWLLILKLLNKKPMSAMEVRRSLTRFNTPHKTTLYATVKMLQAMKMIEATGPVVTERGKEKPYMVTEKGRKILSRAIHHLRSRLELLVEII